MYTTGLLQTQTGWRFGLSVRRGSLSVAESLSLQVRISQLQKLIVELFFVSLAIVFLQACNETGVVVEDHVFEIASLCQCKKTLFGHLRNDSK